MLKDDWHFPCRGSSGCDDLLSAVNRDYEALCRYQCIEKKCTREAVRNLEKCTPSFKTRESPS